MSKGMYRFHAVLVCIFTLTLLSVSIAQNPNVPEAAAKIETRSDLTAAEFVDGKTKIDEVVYEGFDEDLRDYGVVLDHPIYRTTFISEIKFKKAAIEIGDVFSYEKVGAVLTELKSWLSSKGYLKADVKALGKTVAQDRMVLIFSASRGQLVTVKNVEITGSVVVPKEELEHKFFECAQNRWVIYEYSTFQYYSRTCVAQHLFNNGFAKAKIRGIHRTFVGDSYHVRIEVHEGRRYRIGTIKIEGADVISGEAILDGFGLRRGDIADAGKIRSYFVDTLTEMYGERGYADVYVDITFDFDEPDELGLEGVVNFGIQIDEGQCYKVDKIEFPGLPKDEADSLKTEFELKVGDVYQPSKLKAGIERLNQEGQYEFIDRDSDVELLHEIRTDADESSLVVVIHLRKKAQ
jgi:outer membrane protein assembly factor BamA